VGTRFTIGAIDEGRLTEGIRTFCGRVASVVTELGSANAIVGVSLFGLCEKRGRKSIRGRLVGLVRRMSTYDVGRVREVLGS
jgi:hypothetical protein